MSQETYTQEFVFQCPHCSNNVQVSDDVMGEVIDCPVCDSPFKVDVPSARPGDPSQVDGNTPIVDRPDREEGEVAVVHPAMFRTHPFRYLGCVALIAVGILGIVMALTNQEIVSRTFQLIVSGLLTATGAVLLGVWWVKTRYTELTVTTKRTILRKGIVARNTTEVQHDDVRNLQVEQNFMERLLGVGDLAVSSSGQDDLEIDAKDIPAPDEVAELIRDMQ